MTNLIIKPIEFDKCWVPVNASKPGLIPGPSLEMMNFEHFAVKINLNIGSCVVGFQSLRGHGPIQHCDHANANTELIKTVPCTFLSIQPSSGGPDYIVYPAPGVGELIFEISFFLMKNLYLSLETIGFHRNFIGNP